MALDGMAFTLNFRNSTWGGPALLWWSWACVAWFVVAMLIFQYGGSLPSIIVIAAYLSGAFAMIGAALATTYLALVIWMPVRWLPGAGALIANVGCITYFWHSLP